MSIQIHFDLSNQPEKPTFILASKNGRKIGQIEAYHIVSSDALKNPGEISFQVHKFINGRQNPLWNEIKDFKLVWCKEYDTWYQITVNTEEDANTVKTVYGTQLGQAELSQIMLYHIEINTESDISRDEYTMPSVLFQENHPEASILHRIFAKASHYSVIHVDNTIKNIQRTFSFHDTSLYDACKEIEEEIGCLFIFHSNSDERGMIQRTVSVYDLQSNCNFCGHRGDFFGKCPKCGGTDVTEGYGKDTAIFVSSDELGETIQFTTDTDSVKNCFQLEAGDDAMTAAVRNCNPNGTDYIWYISDETKAEMSKTLADKINAYDAFYHYYEKDYSVTIDKGLLAQYNALIKKYQGYHSGLEALPSEIKGYPSLMTAWYQTIDFALYLQSEFMPDVSMSNTSAADQAALLLSERISPVAVEDVSNLSFATANSVVLSCAKSIIDPRYQVKVNASTLQGQTWIGNFSVTNYSHEEDTALSDTISITITDSYEDSVRHKLQKLLNKNNDIENFDVTELFGKNEAAFAMELRKYCLARLTSFYNCCQSCLDILIEQGISDSQTWNDSHPNLYDSLYIPYYKKLEIIAEEIKIRQNEINLITGVYDSNHVLISPGIQSLLQKERNSIQLALDFQNFLGEDLWNEFCFYRREDHYSNSNYISDGLNNRELFEKALEFIETARNEIYKSAELQHSISTDLKNLLSVKKFAPLVEHFEVGNWIRVLVDDTVYRLRLLRYEIDFDHLENISIELSDVMKTAAGTSDQQSLVKSAVSMTSSYSATQKQARQGADGNRLLLNWMEYGLDATNTRIIGGADGQCQTWDEHGMLFRKYNSITDDYAPTQLKIINSTIAITDDFWKTTKAAIGNFYYREPISGNLVNAYGVNGETITGKLILGESLGIYNESASLTFNQNGFQVTNNSNTIEINPNAASLFTIRKGDTPVISLDEEGNGKFSGTITTGSGEIGGWNITNHTLFAQLSSQSVQWVEQPLYDEAGTPICTTESVYNPDGSPVYETDDQGNILYVIDFLYDSNGNPIYKKDSSGNLLYQAETVLDEQGNILYDDGGQPVTNQVPIQDTVQKPVPKTIQIPVVEFVEQMTDTYEDSYVVMNSSRTKGDTAFALGVRELDENGIPDSTKGSIRLCNNGQIYARKYYIHNGSQEPCLYMERVRENGQTTCARMYSWNHDIPAFSFAFRETTDGDYTYSTLINKNGIQPYANNLYSCGTPSRRWGGIYTKDFNAAGSVTLPNLLRMKDDKDRTRKVIQLYHDGETNYGSNLLLEAGGNVFIGSGESASHLYNSFYQNSNTENLFFCSDNYMLFSVGCNVIENRKSVVLDSNLSFRPTTNAVGHLGSASYRWNNIYTAHNVSVSSDERLKKDLSEIYHAKELIMNLIPYQYKFTREGADRLHYGFSSQQFQSAMKQAGIEDCGAWTCDITQKGLENGHTLETASEEEKIYGLRYEEIIAPIVAVLQDIEARVTKIEKQIQLM